MTTRKRMTTRKKGVSMSDLSAVKALVFDVFGTVVDWRTSLINDFTKWSQTSGIRADWTALVDGWRAVYAASMDEVRKNPQNGYVILDVLHRRSLEKLVEQLGIKGLDDRLRRAADRIRAVAEIRFRGQGRLGHRRQRFWRHRRADGLLEHEPESGNRFSSTNATRLRGDHAQYNKLAPAEDHTIPAEA